MHKIRIPCLTYRPPTLERERGVRKAPRTSFALAGPG
jgi:hypothetical protein